MTVEKCDFKIRRSNSSDFVGKNMAPMGWKLIASIVFGYPRFQSEYYAQVVEVGGKNRRSWQQCQFYV